MIGHLTSKPGSSVSNKTGSWRTESKPKFLKKNCIACRMCVYICPEGIIKGETKNTFTCDLEYCKGCGNCVAICPKKDIIMVAEAEEL
jgi:pyruvate ferredoxin oxidoreductase delta subunit